MAQLTDRLTYIFIELPKFVKSAEEMDEVTRDKILENMTTERDLKNQFEYVKKEGRAEGRAETVRKMLSAGIPAEKIADALSITVDECLSYLN